MILHALVRGISDEEIRENVLAKTEELGSNTRTNTAVSKITTYKRDQKSGVSTKPKEI